MATHSSILAWRIPWTEELGGLQSTGCNELDMTEQLCFHFLLNQWFHSIWMENLVTLIGTRHTENQTFLSAFIPIKIYHIDIYNIKSCLNDSSVVVSLRGCTWFDLLFTLINMHIIWSDCLKWLFVISAVYIGCHHCPSPLPTTPLVVTQNLSK